MPHNEKVGRLSQKELDAAIQEERKQFETYYRWISEHMPDSFFQDTEQKYIKILAHHLMGFHLQGYFSRIEFEDCAFVLCLDAPDADMKILRLYSLFGIKNYSTFVSNIPPPFPNINTNLRIAAIYFTSLEESVPDEETCLAKISKEKEEEIFQAIIERNPSMTHEEFHRLMCGMNQRFLRSLTTDRLILALDMFFRAQTRDYCQYEVRYNENWHEKPELIPSMQIVLAWRNVPKHRFLHKLAKMIFRHGLAIRRINLTYINPYRTDSVLIMSIGLHGIHGEAAWKEADLPDFLRELVTLKYFHYLDAIEKTLVDSGLIRGNLGNLVRTMCSFIHQILVHADPNLYSLPHIEEALCRHPELTIKICQLFELKFHFEMQKKDQYDQTREHILSLIEQLDTGNETNDRRRKNVFLQAINFIDHTLKTNFYRNNKSALSFRLDPRYLDFAPYDRKTIFPELPFSIFFVEGMHFIAFHIRFKDLSRGGLRTILPQRFEQMVAERNHVFLECYNLAYTQQKKNKDIPEGGAKGVIFLEPYDRLHIEADIYQRELQRAHIEEPEIKKMVELFQKEQKLEYLYQTQRAFIHSFVTLLNCHPDGSLKAKHIVDYYGHPEYIYLGPDENMHNVMIDWIDSYSQHCGYLPGPAFISSKPTAGINHKEHGVTSYGVNVYMEEMLKYLNVDPTKDPFTIKISGGPDGDVAGNQIQNLYNHFPKTAKLLSLIDISGTIFDPEGLDLAYLVQMFHNNKPIREYPPEKLHKGGYLLDLFTKKTESKYAQQTLCYVNKEGNLLQEWLSGNEMNHLFSNTIHQTKTDIFIPAGGRPRTLNSHNYEDFLDPNGEPTSKAIVEGANLYLTPKARSLLEEKGVLIIKDSSANKGGVICSSYEVLLGLILNTDEFLMQKKEIMHDILSIIRTKCLDEAKLLLFEHQKTGLPLTLLSDKISERINTYKYQLLDYLNTITLKEDHKDPLIRCLFKHCPPFLQKQYSDCILSNIPSGHKKAIIATFIASKLVYHKGLEWQPTIADILPIIAKDPIILND